MRIAVIGTGYVGLVTGVVLADLGNYVTCVDNNSEKIEKLRQGISPIYEPGIEEMIERNLLEKRLSFSTTVAEAMDSAELVFIAVGTPSMPDGSPDLRAVEAVATEIGRSLTSYTVIVNKSTVPVGSGEMVENLILRSGADPAHFDVVSNPEFLREGSAIHDAMNPDRVVIGAKSREAAARLIELYEPLNAPVLITDLESAELIKYASNAFLATKISFINAVSRLCELSGGNVADVAKGMGLDARIGPQFLGAGLGWGGSCFPKDVLGLIDTARQLGYRFSLLEAVDQINEEQTHHFIERMRSALGGFEGKTVGLLGLAFKPNTDDIRYAKSLVIMDAITEGGGTVRAFDPVAMEHVRALRPDTTYTHSAFDTAEGCDAVVLVTEWNEFKQIDLKRLAACMRGDLLCDGRRVYREQAVRDAGLRYLVVGQRSDG